MRDCRSLSAVTVNSASRFVAAARMTGVPFLTTWYGGFRDQNLFKHAYNGVMARGEQVIAMIFTPPQALPPADAIPIPPGAPQPAAPQPAPPQR
jgi:hypothetical protein